MTGGFAPSALYQIVNTRMTERRATIISTNLTPNRIGERYGDAVLSRIWGAHDFLPFYGDDIRRLKKR